MKKATSGRDGYGNTVPPPIQHVKIYFDQKGLSEKAAIGFYQYYKVRKWKTAKDFPIRNWKVAASNWIWLHRENKPLSIDMKVCLQFNSQP